MPKKCDFLDFQFYNLGHSKKKHRRNNLYIIYRYCILVFYSCKSSGKWRVCGPCKKWRCEICEHIVSADSFKSTTTQQTYFVRPENLLCSSKNVAYLFICKICSKQYTWSTEDFRSSFTSYRYAHRNVLKGKTDFAHFSELNYYSEDDWEVGLIDQIDVVEELRKRQIFLATRAEYFSSEWIEWAWSCSYLIFKLSFFYCILDSQILFQQMAVVRTCIFKFKRFYLIYFIYLIYMFTLFTFYIEVFFFIIVFYSFIILWVRRRIREDRNPFDRYILNVSQHVASWRDMSAITYFLTPLYNLVNKSILSLLRW